MEPKQLPRTMEQLIRDAVSQRAVTLAIAGALLLLAVYPGPLLVILRDPAWRTDAVAQKFAEEQAYWTAGLLVIVGPAVALANMIPEQFDRTWEYLRRRLGAVRRGPIITAAALFTGVAAAVAATYVLSRKPTTSDEVAQLWHARILLTGRLSLPADPNPEFFAVDNIIDTGRWYSQFPIGGPAALALAMSLRVTWLLNPMLAALTVVNVFRFGSRAFGAIEARVGAVLCATCPFLLLMSASYMNHTLVTFLVTLALAELPRWSGERQRGQQIASIVIGLALGTAVATRPLDGAIAVLALGGFMVHEAVRNRRVSSLLLTAFVGALPVAWLLVSNWLTTGHPLLFGYQVLWGPNHSIGFHNDPTGNPHTPTRGVLLAILYMMQLNWSLFEWPVTGMLIVAGALAVIGKLGRWDIVLVVWISAQLAAYAAYWHAGNFFGPRYLFTVVPALLLLVARGVVLAERTASPSIRRTIVAGAGACLLSSWLIPSAPVGVLGSAIASRPLRLALKVNFDTVISSVANTKALIFVGETSSARLMRRLWGIGISRPDAARLIATKDNCALLEGVAAEERRLDSTPERLSRLQGIRDYLPPSGFRLLVADPTFRVSNRESITPSCAAEIGRDADAQDAISYGPALLENEIGPDGRIAGPAIFVADLGEHNEVLRTRFSDRTWYRLGFPKGSLDRVPQLTPYR